MSLSEERNNTVYDTENVSAVFHGAPSQVTATAAWIAAEIPCGTRGLSAIADYVYTYV